MMTSRRHRLVPAALAAALLTFAFSTSTAAAAVYGGLRAMPDPDEAPPSAVGLAIATGLTFLVITAVAVAIRIARKRRGWEQTGQRQRYGNETEDLVAEIDSAWAARDEEMLSQLISEELMRQWHSRLDKEPADDEAQIRVDRIDARFVSRELPDPDEDDRVVMRVRARCQRSA